MARNQQAKFFLRKWPYFDQNINYLTDVEKVNIKILYTALKQLTESQRKLLAEKYRVFDGLPINDSVLARERGITLKEYREIRIIYESDFQAFLNEAKEKYKEQFNKAMGIQSVPAETLSLKEVNRLLKEFNESPEQEKNELFSWMC
ncbi:hypothetical protein [Paraliobacillus zengyii]|uniref:hypothetical protein n=1 Tax=Paraliobacillus zengyii TaxID=2213194 RepID=UPI000DD2D631|nr:hypothetical protein [Paraliobacillus zengyii]